jgi:flagellar biosynthesis protein FlhB
MSGDRGSRTEEPTPRRLREARRRGQVAVSAEATGAAALAGGLLALGAAGPALAAAIARALRAALAGAALAPPAPEAALRSAAALLLRCAAPPAAGALAGALAGGLLQTRLLFAPSALAPRLERLSPLAGLRRVLSPARLGAVGLGLVRAAALLLVGFAWLGRNARALAGLAATSGAGLWRAPGLLLGLSLRLAAALAALALVDLWRVRRRHRAALRMTRDEVRRENREEQGDPAVRGERGRLYRALLEAGPVARATVVVVNPTHVAVALRHDRGDPGAPRVLSKGRGRAAARIRSAARRAGVPVVRDVALARALFRLAEIGDEIPEVLYDAAAVVLARLYGAEGTA